MNSRQEEDSQHDDSGVISALSVNTAVLVAKCAVSKDDEFDPDFVADTVMDLMEQAIKRQEFVVAVEAGRAAGIFRLDFSGLFHIMDGNSKNEDPGIYDVGVIATKKITLLPIGTNEGD